MKHNHIRKYLPVIIKSEAYANKLIFTYVVNQRGKYRSFDLNLHIHFYSIIVIKLMTIGN